MKKITSYSLVLLCFLLCSSCDSIINPNVSRLSLELQIEVKEWIIDLAADSQDSSFKAALAAADIPQKDKREDYISLFAKAYSKATTRPLASIFSISEDLREYDINVTSSNDEVLKAIRGVVAEKGEEALVILKERIEESSESLVDISHDKSKNTIVLEVRNVENIERFKKYLLASANLEFWDLYQNTDLLERIAKLNDILKKDSTKSNSSPLKTEEIKKDDIDLTIDELLEDQSEIETDYGPIFNLLSPNQQRESADIGYTDAKNMAAVDELLNSPEAKKMLSKSIRFAWAKNPFPSQNGDSAQMHVLYAINTKGRKVARLNGEHIVSAFATPNPGGQGYAVSISMNQDGARIWKKMTTNNVGRQLAMTVDGSVFSAPMVQEPIAGGQTSISGVFDEVSSATDLANLLTVGKLPCQLKILKEEIISNSK